MKIFFKSLNILNEEELNQVENLCSIRFVKKGGYLIKEGSISKEIFLIKKGALRLFYTNSAGNEITSCLAFDNEMISAYASFITESQTEENIQAVSDSEIVLLKKHDLDFLYKQGTVWQKVGRIIAEMHYIELTKKIVSFQKDTAKERYNQLLQKHPEYIQVIPQHQLASLLGITPRHLSRLKKEVCK
ncbi:Crp/Fnr family transcriptional regulator [uncultured Cytophaga sp.]|uniref:Crp/Fnr family transcriptional regulator n=1 Tax=uncultured Cytophaga sp. TaxID=160238 RepID=UPI00260AD160|nr:Crp/Fnr family transcriptional regulator [uncultured Cytophaga sp.]